MKFTVASLVLPGIVSGFSISKQTLKNFPLYSTTSSATLDTDAVTCTPQEALLDTATKLQAEFGLFLVDKTAKRDVAECVENVEAEFATTNAGVTAASLVGEWELLCTTTTSTEGVDTAAFLPKPLKQVTDKISETTNKYVHVSQNIRSSNNNSTTTMIDRIDHVISYQPPNQLTDVLSIFFPTLPDAVKNVNVNPLDVSQSKLVLVHKAKGTSESTDDASALSLQLQSVVWNVAGRNSTYLDPAGRDLASINLPFQEFLRSGTFTTTYVDDTLRVARGKQGPLEILRVFKKKEDVVEEEEPVVMDVQDIPDAEIIDDIMAADEEEEDEDKPSDVGTVGP